MESNALDNAITIKDTMQTPPELEIPEWRKLFKKLSEMDQSPMKFPIANFLPEGVTFLGALPGSGKTWLCLSMAKAICTGRKFLGSLTVEEPTNVLYLIPEVGERQFRQRMEAMEIPDDDRFLCRTLSQGPLRLNHQGLLRAVQNLKPIVFLDTAVRFNPSPDENDAAKSAKLLTEAIFQLRHEGAAAVVCAHHSTKAVSGNVTLETCLRGTGELAAMCDAVYYLEVKDRASFKVRIQNLKARDFEQIPPFEIVGRPYIDDTGDFSPVECILEPAFAQIEKERERRVRFAIEANPKATYSELQIELNIPRATLQRIAKKLGLSKGVEWSKVQTTQPDDGKRIRKPYLN
jgi:RecA-family ATPase